jgi:hypothetical protein
MNFTKTAYTVPLLIVGLGLAVNGYSQSFLTNGLVAYYPFNGNANDASGNGNNGQIVGNVVPATDRFGNPSSAYAFDGVSSSAIEVTNTLFNVGQEGYTISGWFASSNVYLGTLQDIIQTMPQAGLDVGFNPSAAPYPVFSVGPTGTWTEQTIHGNQPSCVNQTWYQFVLTKSGTSYTLYVDGQVSCQQTISAASGYDANVGCIIGSITPINPSYHETFMGCLDDFRIYNRTLSSNQVQELYAYESVPQSFLTNGLVAYYPFNGNANDQSGNGNDGTVFGAILATNRFGVSGMAYQFNGTNSYISANVPNLPTNSTPRTISLWAASAQPINTSCLLFWGTPQNREGFGIIGNGTPHTWQGQTWGGGDDVNSGVVIDANWHQIVVVYDGSLLSISIDGVQDGTLSESINTGFSTLTIGADTNNSAPDQFFGGAIDDVRIYNVALSTNEIAQLYAIESTPPSPPCTPYAATATATVVDEFCVAATITDGGCGYTNTPLVLIVGGGGAGAIGTAFVSNGVVAGIRITDAGSNYTGTPIIYIGSPPSITAQPQSLVVNAYDTASFSLTASGTVPLAIPLNYQWSFNGTNISGATSTSLTISNVVPTNLGTYVVVVTNLFGSVISSNATLFMYPYIETPFTGIVTDWGYTNTLSVVAWGTGPLSYQWYDNGAAIVNATNETLNLSSIQFTNAGIYTVVVTTPLGSVTNAPEEVVVNPAGISLGMYPGVTVSGVVGYTYMIQSTLNLGNTNSWVTLTNLTLAQPVQLWVDTSDNSSSPTNAQRFYRVLPGQ